MAELDLPEDYCDLLIELLHADADFVVVGGWAVAVHGHGRATDDLDIFIRPSKDNAARVIAALTEFGAPLEAHGVTADLFSSAGYGYRIGSKPLLIELLTDIDGVDFEQARDGALLVRVADRLVPFIGRDSLLANKRASGRAKDLADIEALEQGED